LTCYTLGRGAPGGACSSLRSTGRKGLPYATPKMAFPERTHSTSIPN